MSVRPDVDELISFLNDLLTVDRYAVAELLTVRVPCNRAMADHPTVQVQGNGAGTTFIAPGSHRVGVLGLLNGYCGTIDTGERAGWGPITVVYEDGALVRFERTKE